MKSFAGAYNAKALNILLILFLLHSIPINAGALWSSAAHERSFFTVRARGAHGWRLALGDGAVLSLSHEEEEEGQSARPNLPRQELEQKGNEFSWLDKWVRGLLLVYFHNRIHQHGEPTVTGRGTRVCRGSSAGLMSTLMRLSWRSWGWRVSRGGQGFAFPWLVWVWRAEIRLCILHLVQLPGSIPALTRTFAHCLLCSLQTL